MLHKKPPKYLKFTIVAIAAAAAALGATTAIANADIADNPGSHHVRVSAPDGVKAINVFKGNQFIKCFEPNGAEWQDVTLQNGSALIAENGSEITAEGYSVDCSKLGPDFQPTHFAKVTGQADELDYIWITLQPLQPAA